MITMAVFAILGAALGLFFRPRWLGVTLPIALALLVEGAAHWAIGVMEHQVNREVLVMRLHAVFGEDWIGATGPVAAAVVSAIVAAVLGAMTEPKVATPVLTAEGIRRRAGKDGRYARAEGMVEERAIHAQAESRIESILGL